MPPSNPRNHIESWNHLTRVQRMCNSVLRVCLSLTCLDRDEVASTTRNAWTDVRPGTGVIISIPETYTRVEVTITHDAQVVTRYARDPATHERRRVIGAAW